MDDGGQWTADGGTDELCTVVSPLPELTSGDLGGGGVLL